MKDNIYLKAELKQFTGSEQIFYNPLFPKFRYTEGIRYLAMEAHCYWLLDYIFSHQALAEMKDQDFQVWILDVAQDNTAILTVEDGNKNKIKTFQLEFTDFPLQQIDLWFIEGTLLLPSEY